MILKIGMLVNSGWHLVFIGLFHIVIWKAFCGTSNGSWKKIVCHQRMQQPQNYIWKYYCKSLWFGMEGVFEMSKQCSFHVRHDTWFASKVWSVLFWSIGSRLMTGTVTELLWIAHSHELRIPSEADLPFPLWSDEVYEKWEQGTAGWTGFSIKTSVGGRVQTLYLPTVWLFFF